MPHCFQPTVCLPVPEPDAPWCMPAPVLGGHVGQRELLLGLVCEPLARNV